MLCFYSETGFWPSYCQISTDLDKILHTYCCTKTLVGRLRPQSERGQLQAKPKRLCFLYRQSGGEDGCYREKFRNFVAWAEPGPKNTIFAL